MNGIDPGKIFTQLTLINRLNICPSQLITAIIEYYIIF